MTSFPRASILISPLISAQFFFPLDIIAQHHLLRELIVPHSDLGARCANVMATVINSELPINGVVYLGAAPKLAGIGNVDQKGCGPGVGCCIT